MGVNPKSYRFDYALSALPLWGSTMALQESTTLAGRPARKFTPANIQKIKDWVAEGISREEIAKSLDCRLPPSHMLKIGHQLAEARLA